MNRSRSIYLSALLVLFILSLFAIPDHTLAQQEPTWRAGVAVADITPEDGLWMGGFAARNQPAQGRQHPLYAKAMVLEDADGDQALLITTDLLGFPSELSNPIRDRLEQEIGLGREAVILNSSHTHSGPVLRQSLFDIYPLDEPHQALILEYSDWLADQIVDLASQAVDDLRPVRLHAGNGVARFQVNRRNNPAQTLYRSTELSGPHDPAVPVIRVTDSTSGKLVAVTFGYACHPTVLSDYEWSGDFPGFAQIELEKRHEGAVALFFQGAGADQNPLPRGGTPLARQYGHSLAAAVDAVLETEMRELAPELGVAYSEVSLPLAEPKSDEELVGIRDESSGYMARWAERILRERDEGVDHPDQYPYPVQVWKLGDQPLFSLGGELVIEYAIRLKEIFGRDSFVAGYSNDVMAYIPSSRILEEGGYEGHTSHKVYGLPAPWTPVVESLILDEIIRIAPQAGVEPVRHNH